MHSRTPLPAPTGLLDQLKLDHCGGEPSAAQQVILSLLGSAVAKHTSVSGYLRSLPSPWVNKRSNVAWRLVEDTSKLERHIARLVECLVNPTLERKAVPVEDIRSLVARREAEQAAPEAATEPDEDAPGCALEPILAPQAPE